MGLGLSLSLALVIDTSNRSGSDSSAIVTCAFNTWAKDVAGRRVSTASNTNATYKASRGHTRCKLGTIKRIGERNVQPRSREDRRGEGDVRDGTHATVSIAGSLFVEGRRRRGRDGAVNVVAINVIIANGECLLRK